MNLPIQYENPKSPLSRPKPLVNREHFSLLTHQERTRAVRAISESNIAEQALIADSKDGDELLETAPQTYYYYPSLRVRQIYRRRYDVPSRGAFSNYANNYDEFPTVA